MKLEALRASELFLTSDFTDLTDGYIFDIQCVVVLSPFQVDGMDGVLTCETHQSH